MPSPLTGQTVALLIPAYNAEAFLPRLLESARAQTAGFDAILVYDDASSDSTRAVAEAHQALVVTGGTNRGCTQGKQALAEICQSDWLHFHDADDLILPDFVERAHAWMDEDGADVIAFGCEERWEETGEVISRAIQDDALLSSDPVRATITSKINAISGLYRRSRFLEAGGFDIDAAVHFNEDQALHCRLARGGLRFRADEHVTVVNFRQRSSMWVSNQDRALAAHYQVMVRALEGPQGWANRDAIADRLWHVAGGAAAQLDWRTADSAAIMAMRIWGPTTASRLFAALCRLSPTAALRIREYAIRTFKPALRAAYPARRSR